MLNCIIATMRPKSGTKRPRTPASFIRRSTLSGAFFEVRISRKSLLARGSFRTSASISFSDRLASRLASGWMATSFLSASQNSAIRFTGSRANTPTSFTVTRSFSMTKSLDCWRSVFVRRNEPITRSSIGLGLAWRASSAAQTIAVRSPTSFARRKYAFMKRSTCESPTRWE